MYQVLAIDVVEISSTFACKLEMLLLVVSNGYVSRPVRARVSFEVQRVVDSHQANL